MILLILSIWILLIQYQRPVESEKVDQGPEKTQEADQGPVKSEEVTEGTEVSEVTEDLASPDDNVTTEIGTQTVVCPTIKPIWDEVDFGNKVDGFISRNVVPKYNKTINDIGKTVEGFIAKYVNKIEDFATKDVKPKIDKFFGDIADWFKGKSKN